MNERAAQAVALGARRPRRIPREVREGRFILPFTITDNATTASDVTASMADILLLDVAGLGSTATTDPSLVIVLESLGAIIVEASETPAVLNGVLKGLRLTHTPGEGDDKQIVALHDHLTSWFKTAGIAVGPLVSQTLQRPETFPLDHPMWVDLTTDSLSVDVVSATDSAANVAGVLVCDGFVFRRDTGFSRELLRDKTYTRDIDRRIKERRRAKFMDRRMVA